MLKVGLTYSKATKIDCFANIEFSPDKVTSSSLFLGEEWIANI